MTGQSLPAAPPLCAGPTRVPKLGWDMTTDSWREGVQREWGNKDGSLDCSGLKTGFAINSSVPHFPPL